ncbi:DUF397 domain-containing protein [Streptomyces adelaidensis]|uniref:DUF397 domain-containing protein n=1 Tax=Streptomyces adelaidensis TaxID=2796465 RepID=UPI001904EEC1|nr:DUF397 domain-containing protein [Streptomyces adelaidensis]
MSPTLHWQKSSFSAADDDNACVEIATSPATLHLRESDHPVTVITPAPAALHALLTALRGTR